MNLGTTEMSIPFVIIIIIDNHYNNIYCAYTEIPSTRFPDMMSPVLIQISHLISGHNIILAHFYTY